MLVTHLPLQQCKKAKVLTTLAGNTSAEVHTNWRAFLSPLGRSIDGCILLLLLNAFAALLHSTLDWEEVFSITVAATAAGLYTIQMVLVTVTNSKEIKHQEQVPQQQVGVGSCADSCLNLT